MYKIYALCDPDGTMRYVGSTRDNLEKRCRDHVLACQKETSKKARWLRALIDTGAKPSIVLLEECETVQQSSMREGVWIEKLRHLGSLTNVRESGRLGTLAPKPYRTYKLCAFTLPDDAREKLNRLAKLWRLPKSTTVQRLILLAAEEPMIEPY